MNWHSPPVELMPVPVPEQQLHIWPNGHPPNTEATAEAFVDAFDT